MLLDIEVDLAMADLVIYHRLDTWTVICLKEGRRLEEIIEVITKTRARIVAITEEEALISTQTTEVEDLDKTAAEEITEAVDNTPSISIVKAVAR